MDEESESTDWGSFFQDQLGTLVDATSDVAKTVAGVKVAQAAQNTTAVKTAASVSPTNAVTNNATTTTAANANMQKYMMIGGAVLVVLLLLRT